MVCWLFFNFTVLFDLGCCSLAQEMSFLDRYLPYFRQWLITHPLVALLPFQLFIYWSLQGDQLLASLPPSPVLCASFQFLVYSVFFVGGGQSTQGTMLAHSRGGWRNTTWHLVLTCLVCLMSPKQVWSWWLVTVGALLFSQCNMVWRSFIWARGSGCWSFDSPWCFISAVCGSSISVRFWSHRAHAVCFCALVAIFYISPLSECGWASFFHLGTMD
jgi:hypothetical protein